MDDQQLKKAESLRSALDGELKRRFLRYLQDCKQQLELDATQSELRDALRSTAQALLRKSHDAAHEEPK